jgi:hypothetical protein
MATEANRRKIRRMQEAERQIARSLDIELKLIKEERRERAIRLGFERTGDEDTRDARALVRDRA